MDEGEGTEDAGNRSPGHGEITVTQVGKDDSGDGPGEVGEKFDDGNQEFRYVGLPTIPYICLSIGCFVIYIANIHITEQDNMSVIISVQCFPSKVFFPIVLIPFGTVPMARPK